MASLTKKQRAHEQQIKQAIVESHRAGLCNSEGGPIPPNRHIEGIRSRATTPEYRRNYGRAFGSEE